MLNRIDILTLFPDFVSSYTYNSGSVANPRLFILGSNNSTDNNMIGQLNLIDQSSQYVVTYLGNGSGNAFGVGNYQSGGSISLGTPYMYTNISTYSGTAYTNLTLVNGVTGTYTSKSGTMSPNSSYVGSYNRYSVGTYIYTTPGPNGDAFNGNVYEVIVFNTNLGTPQQQQVEAYLSQKWGLTSTLPSGHPGLTTTVYQSSYLKTAGVKMNICRMLPYYTTFSPQSIPNCLFWFDAADGSTITTSGSQVTAWLNKGSWSGSATNYSGTVVSGSKTYNGLNALVFPTNGELRFTAAIPYQPRAWFAVFNQTTQVTVSGPNFKQYFAIINQTQGSGQDSAFGPGIPTTQGTTSYVMSEGPSGNPNGVNTGNTVPDGYNQLKQYGWINSASSTASNFQTVNGTTYTLTNNYTATAYRTDSVIYSINTGWYNNSCDLAEIIMFNAEITTTQRQQVESYLAQKWGLTSYLPSGHLQFTQPTGAVTTLSLTNNKITMSPRYSSVGLAITHQDGRVWKISGTGQGASMGLNTGTAMSLTIYAGSDVYNSAGGRVGLFDNGNINNAVRHAGYVMWTYTFVANNFDFGWYFVSSGSGYLIYNDYPSIGSAWQATYDPSADRVLIVAPGDAKYGMVWNVTPKVTLAYVHTSYP